MKAQLLIPTGEVRDITPVNGTDFTLEELQEYVGGYVEKINLKDGKAMFVNEDGIADSFLPNEEASRLFGMGMIYGNAVVCDKGMVL